MQRIFKISLYVKDKKITTRTLKLDAVATNGVFQIALAKLQHKILSSVIRWEVDEEPPKH